MAGTITSEFRSTLSRFVTKNKDEDVFEEFTLRVEEISEYPRFLEGFEKSTGLENVEHLLQHPVMASNVVIPDLNQDYAISFDVLEEDLIKARLQTIKVRRSIKKSDTVFTYDLVFKKESEPEIDKDFKSYLNQKETDENGKKVTVKYSTLLARKGSDSYVDAGEN